MDEETKEEVAEETIDGRTTIGKIQAKLKQLEDTQGEILKQLAEHKKRIDICSIQR